MRTQVSLSMILATAMILVIGAGCGTKVSEQDVMNQDVSGNDLVTDMAVVDAEDTHVADVPGSDEGAADVVNPDVIVLDVASDADVSGSDENAADVVSVDVEDGDESDGDVADVFADAADAADAADPADASDADAGILLPVGQCTECVLELGCGPGFDCASFVGGAHLCVQQCSALDPTCPEGSACAGDSFCSPDATGVFECIGEDMMGADTCGNIWTAFTCELGVTFCSLDPFGCIPVTE